MAAQQLQNEFTMSRPCDKDIMFTEADKRIESGFGPVLTSM